jgi:putative transposase
MIFRRRIKPMYKDKWKNYFFPSKDKPLKDKWTLIREVGKDILSLKAQAKLEWIIFYHTYGKQNARLTSSHFGISRKTFHKWLRRFEEKNLRSLEEHSREPKKKRDWLVTWEEEGRIKKLRKENLELGKKKLKVLYLKKYQENISTWKIERVIRRFNLYPEVVDHKYQVDKKRKSSFKPKIRINQIKDSIKEINQFGFLWHIDAIIIWWYGERRILFTAIEDLTKIAFARVSPSNASIYATDFLKRLMYLVEGKVNLMHSDNGSEFKKNFEKACKTLGIIQVYSRPKTPKDNPALEKFNDTIQREWLRLSEVGLDNIQEANQDLTNWLIKYNSIRPHQALDYLTPLEYAEKYYFSKQKVLPMFPASTSP